MSADATEALRRLMAALEEHLDAVAMRRGDADAAVDDAFEAVATEFERYEEALDTEYGETLPIVLDEVDVDDEYLDEDDDAEDDERDDIEDEALDPHAVEDDDDMDDDIEQFELR